MSDITDIQLVRNNIQKKIQLWMQSMAEANDGRPLEGTFMVDYGFTELEQAVYDTDKHQQVIKLEARICPNCDVPLVREEGHHWWNRKDMRCPKCGFGLSGV